MRIEMLCYDRSWCAGGGEMLGYLQGLATLFACVLFVQLKTPFLAGIATKIGY